ncbi:MAG: 3-hydroxyacyl-CoA dehydrogenase NAD-binding domain-containing protein, partial [Pseudomonadota bacterium]
MSEIRSVGVIGAGQMGTGIAQVFAQAGYKVLLNDIDAEKLQAGLGGIALQLDKMVAREKLSVADHASTLGRLSATQDLSELGAADLIVESATEHEQVKVQIFQSLAPHLGADTLLTTNTSSISITRLAAGTDRPQRFMGMH